MGAYLSVANKDKESGDGENGNLRYGVSSMQGWRISMEDAHATILDIDNATSFFAVYDGHGGKAVARFCSRHLHDVLLSSEPYKKGNLDEALKSTFLRMDEIVMMEETREELKALAQGLNFPKKRSVLVTESGETPATVQGSKSATEKVGNGDSSKNGTNSESGKPNEGALKEAVVLGEEEEEEIFVEAVEEPEDYWTSEEPTSNGSMNEATSAGCTAVVAVIRGKDLIVANAGDSRCVLSSRGKAVDMSKDHKPELEEERARIESANGFVEFGRVNGSLALSRAIGDLEYKRNPAKGPSAQMVTALPEIQFHKIDAEDEFVILACDGIWDVMSSQEAVDFVRDRLVKYPNRKLSEIVEEMFDHCIAPNSEGDGLGMDNMSAVIVTLNPIKK